MAKPGRAKPRSAWLKLAPPFRVSRQAASRVRPHLTLEKDAVGKADRRGGEQNEQDARHQVDAHRDSSSSTTEQTRGVGKGSMSGMVQRLVKGWKQVLGRRPWEGGERRRALLATCPPRRRWFPGIPWYSRSMFQGICVYQSSESVRASESVTKTAAARVRAPWAAAARSWRRCATSQRPPPPRSPCPSPPLPFPSMAAPPPLHYSSTSPSPLP